MGKYKEEIEKMRWSFSRVHSFEQCKYMWYLQYLLTDGEGKPIYETEQNFYAAFGSLCHKILEKILTGQITVEEGVEEYKERYDDETDIIDRKDNISQKYYRLGLSYFNNEKLEWLKNYEILGVEKKVTFTINSYEFVGYIDLLLMNKSRGELVIVDHKSAEYPIGKKGSVLKRKEKDHLAYKRQLYLYAKPVFEKYGVYPAYIKWNYFKEQKWLELQFSRTEYEEALAWAENEIKKIEKEEDFNEHKDYFFCHNLCCFRTSCDYVEGDEDE